MINPVELATQLLACPSITPDDAGCQPLIAKELTRLGFHCESMRFGEVDNLYARLGNTTPLVVFAGHTDVVPPGPLADWTSPPFQPEIRDGCLYGRGAQDMKGAIAAMLAATEKFLKSPQKFKGSIAFLITSDEEGESINGTQKIIAALSARNEKIAYCIVGEPSSEQQVGDQIRVGRRGSLHGKLIVRGKQGHVAYPELAQNPIHLTALALHKLADTMWDEGDAHFPKTTFQISNLHSGTGALNVIPGHLEVLFNFRFSPAVTIDELKTRTLDILNQYDLKYSLDWNLGGEPFLTSHGRLLKATTEAIHQITGLHVKLSTGGGTSDGRFIAKTGAEVIELGTTHHYAHQVNEHVKVEELDHLTAIYEQLLIRLLHSP